MHALWWQNSILSTLDALTSIESSIPLYLEFYGAPDRGLNQRPVELQYHNLTTTPQETLHCF